MTAFWIFSKTHRLKTIVKNAASKNTGFTRNLAKTYPEKSFKEKMKLKYEINNGYYNVRTKFQDS